MLVKLLLMLLRLLFLFLLLFCSCCYCCSFSAAADVDCFCYCLLGCLFVGVSGYLFVCYCMYVRLLGLFVFCLRGWDHYIEFCVPQQHREIYRVSVSLINIHQHTRPSAEIVKLTPYRGTTFTSILLSGKKLSNVIVGILNTVILSCSSIYLNYALPFRLGNKNTQ